MKAGSFHVDLVSWDSAISLSKILAGKIRASGFSPDLVIAIGRGGYIPARIVCDRLLMSDLTSIKIEHWGTAAQKSGEARIRFPLSVDIEGLAVLVIDDVTDTGETLISARDYLRRNNPREIRSGVLQHKTSSTFQPDYYAELLTEWSWIVYPWALHEDIIGFLEKILTPRPVSPDELARILAQRYAMHPGRRDLLLALEDMAALGSVIRTGNLYAVPPQDPRQV